MNKNIAKIQKICCPICGYELTVETVSLNCPKCNCRFSFFDGNFIIENYNKNNIISGDSGIFLKSKSDILKFYKTLFVNHNGENISGFMNYGAITDEDYSEKEYSFDELSEILLKSIISDLNFKSSKILEIGCGRGGNINYLAKYYDFCQLIGLDFVPENIEFCKSKNKYNNCNFVIGDAEGFFIKEYFDYVLNIESSLHYNDLLKFFENSKRCLKKGGKLILADAILSENVENYLQLMKRVGFTNIIEKDYSREVIKANDYKRSRLKPKYTSEITKNDDIGVGLRNGTVRYVVFYAVA